MEHVEDEDDCFEAIRKLIAQGINAGDIKKLQDAGIYTYHGLMMPTKKSITGIKRLSEAVDKICEAAGKIIRRSVAKMTTGSQVIDELLGGENSAARSGKTQLAHTLCVSTELPLSMHGGNGKVAYIDTEGRLYALDSGAVLDNIIYARAYTYEHQYNLLGLAANMSEEPFRLPISDSIIALFRVDISGRGELAESQQRLAQILSDVNFCMNDKGSVFILNSKNPARDGALYQEATGRLIFLGKGEQTNIMTVSQEALDILFGGFSQATLAGARKHGGPSQHWKKKVKNSNPPGKKKSKGCHSSQPNLHMVKIGKKKMKARGYPLLFKEHRLTGISDVFDMSTWTWEARSFEIPPDTELLLAYQQDSLLAVRRSLPDQLNSRGLKCSAYPLEEGFWRDLGILEYSRLRLYLVGSNFRWLVVAAVGMSTRMYNRSSWHYEPLVLPALPLNDGVFHALQAGIYFFVMSHPNNQFSALKMNQYAKSWTDPIELAEPGHRVVMVGLYGNKLIVVKCRSNNVRNVEILALRLDFRGVPVLERPELITLVPHRVVMKIRLHDSVHPENHVRMFGNFLFFYRRPELHIYDFANQNWDFSENTLPPCN